jgi:hypothetical protein
MNSIRIGAIGAGGFGQFALQQFIQVQGGDLVAIPTSPTSHWRPRWRRLIEGCLGRGEVVAPQRVLSQGCAAMQLADSRA